MVQDLSIRLDNLDARDTRQLNQVYAEVKKVEGTIHSCGRLEHFIIVVIAVTIACKCKSGGKLTLFQVCCKRSKSA